MTWRTLLIPLIAAVGLRALVLASGAVSFHSDEAIVGLMARHINAGEPIPVFFYGQPYMGSLEPLLVAVAFRFLGESVLTIRLVEAAIYLGIMATTAILAYRLTGEARIALFAGLLLAIPPVVLTTYTTLSLGGYGEVLLLGNLLLIGVVEARHSAGRLAWIAIGLAAGLGWWTNALIAVYFVPAIAGLATMPRSSAATTRFQNVWRMGLAALGFLIGSAPWWAYNLSYEWEAARFLSGGFQASGVSAPGLVDKAFGLVIFGLPAVLGVRYPWAQTYWPGLLALVICGLYLVLLILARRQAGLALLWLMIAGFIAIFVLSGFGIDATGRYLLPLIVPVTILVAAYLGGQIGRLAGSLGLIVILVVNFGGTLNALATNPPGVTPQFDPSTDLPNTDDRAVIDFLKAHDGQYGYATYWVAYRLDFLSGEQITLSPLLPYKYPYTAGGPDRYPLYTARVQAADRPVLVTANLPDLDTAIGARLATLGITYERQAIGPFRVYFQLSRRMTSDDLSGPWPIP
ncbi:MAG TPA: hypothetical protein VMT34_00815 [Aggregatilineales bacterium]|nr:hypothetical protein [Aggregatilineales bacterium]